MDLAQGSYLSPLGLCDFILIIFVFRLNYKPLLRSLELLCGLYCELYGFFIFGKKEGLYCEIDDVANATNSVVNSNLSREALLYNSTELIIAAVVVTYIWYSQ
jgi:hypothetical protein